MNREITHREHASSEDSFDRAVVQVLVENPHIHLKEIDVSGSNPLLVARSEPWDSTKPTVFISAGIHGDEPAGVHAAVQFLNHGLPEYADRFNFVVMPCLNPDGFDTQTHNSFNKSTGKFHKRLSTTGRAKTKILCSSL